MQIVVNGESTQVQADSTVADLLAQLGVNVQYCAVELNLELVPRTTHARRRLAPGDRVEVVTLVGGG